MAKFEIIFARDKRIREWTQYDAAITIKDGGKNPVTMDMAFDSIPPSAVDLPKTHQIGAETLIQAYSKVVKLFDRYGFIFK